MNKKTSLKIISSTAIFVTLSGCKPVPDQELVQYKAENPHVVNEGQVHFALDSLGTLSIDGLLKTNIIPVKIYGTALLMMDNKNNGGAIDGKRLPEVMQKYGFLRSKKIDNWRSDWAPEPAVETNVGFLHAMLDLKVFGFEEAKLEVANVTCAACHSGTTYDANGQPTGNAWLGSPNSSLNFDGFLNSIYDGLKVGMADQKAFMKEIRAAWPEMDPIEEKTIQKHILPRVADALDKMKQMNHVLPFPNGGPGLTNGIGAFKRDADLLAEPYVYNPNEAGFVSIPDISYRGFRSSFTYDGVYAVKNEPRYRQIGADEAHNDDHLNKLSHLAAFFTYSAMGNMLENIEPHLNDVTNIFSFLKELTPPTFPGKIDNDLAMKGSQVFAENCTSCHGAYTPGVDRPQLTSFPNRFVPENVIGTDSLRWSSVTPAVKKFADKNIFSKYIDAGQQLGGYVAPILSGIWATAPYLHNGSVPTLWHLLHPSERPGIFQYGGHSLDFTKVGIRGELSTKGEYLYPSDVKPWSTSAIYDTTKPGSSNRGHEKQVNLLNEDEKAAVLEYMKLL